jgi:hypothetical protein
MKALLPLLFAAFCLSSVAQSSDVELLTQPIPHPYVSFGPSVMGGGYAPFAYRAEAGFDLESSHAMFRALGAYDNGHKIDDNDQPNPDGHDRYLEGAAYFRARRGWFAGGGWTWSRLYTTKYAKGGGHPEIGGGYDLALHSCDGCRRNLSMRIDVDWITAGTDWHNGVHGPNTTFTFPSPSEKRHLFWRESFGIYRIHESVTTPSDPVLTRQQLSDKSIDTFEDFGVIYRF